MHIKQEKLQAFMWKEALFQVDFVVFHLCQKVARFTSLNARFGFNVLIHPKKVFGIVFLFQ
jgi:hypothetical protein